MSTFLLSKEWSSFHLYKNFASPKEGDEVKVKVIGFDRGKVKLSMKQAK